MSRPGIAQTMKLKLGFQPGMTREEKAQMETLALAEIAAWTEEIHLRIWMESGRWTSGPEEQAWKDAKAEVERLRRAQVEIWMGAEARRRAKGHN